MNKLFYRYIRDVQEHKKTDRVDREIEWFATRGTHVRFKSTATNSIHNAMVQKLPESEVRQFDGSLPSGCWILTVGWAVARHLVSRYMR